MYKLLLLLLFATPVNAELTAEQLCKELAVEVQIAIDEGIIDKQAGVALIDGCWGEDNRPAAD